MSQITERTNIISYSEIPSISEVHASMVNLNELSGYQPLSSFIPDMKTYCPGNILSAINATSGNLSFVSSSTSVSSPNSLRMIFADSFSPAVKKMQVKGLSSLDAKKASLLATLSKMDIKVTDSQYVKSSIKSIINASDDKVLNTEIKGVMNHLEAVHTKVFAANLAKVCATASLKVGFNLVTIKPVNGKLEVIAKNHEGKHLVSEITVDSKTSRVDCNTETIGITDGSCKLIIKQFNDELKKLGVKIGNEKTTLTGGACQMSYSKIIDQNEKEQQNKKKEQDRMRKMNTIQKTKILN